MKRMVFCVLCWLALCGCSSDDPVEPDNGGSQEVINHPSEIVNELTVNFVVKDEQPLLKIDVYVEILNPSVGINPWNILIPGNPNAGYTLFEFKLTNMWNTEGLDKFWIEEDNCNWNDDLLAEQIGGSNPAYEYVYQSNYEMVHNYWYGLEDIWQSPSGPRHTFTEAYIGADGLQIKMSHRNQYSSGINDGINQLPWTTSGKLVSIIATLRPNRSDWINIDDLAFIRPDSGQIVGLDYGFENDIRAIKLNYQINGADIESWYWWLK